MPDSSYEVTIILRQRISGEDFKWAQGFLNNLLYKCSQANLSEFVDCFYCQTLPKESD